MEVKKNPRANLENHNKQFMLLGLALALLVIYIGIEWKTFDRTVGDLGLSNLTDDDEIEIPITERIKEIKPPPPPPPTPEKIEIVEDEEEIEETVLESTETDESEAVEVEEIVEIEEEEEIDDVPFAIIEEVPGYPGCKGNNTQKKKCFMEKIQKHVARKYNTGLAGDLGLSPGKKRVYVQFKIDKSGNIVDVRARGPHKRLEKEAVRVISLLPKMSPGRQRGRPVGVKYTLPVTLIVE